MVEQFKVIAPMLGGLALLLGAAAAPSAAQAGAPGCCKPKPPCCKPKGHDVHVPGVKVYPPQVIITPPSVNVNVGVKAIANASAVSSASASANNSVMFFGGGGGGGGFGTPGTPNYVSNFNVEGAAMQRVPYSASRTQIKTVVIRAVCIDDRETPHPASQVFPGQDVKDAYEGELFRCIAGTRLSVTVGDWLGKVAFDGGTVINCKKGEAIHHGAGGELSCRKQRPARDCNERSLLRRYGVGVKVFKMTKIETYTAYREETVTSAHAGSIVLDGGVGGLQF